MKHSKKILKTPLRAALCTLLIGMLTKIVHWPYASGIIFVSFAAILAMYTMRFYKKEEKQPIDFVKMILVLFWTTNGLLTILEFMYTFLFQLGTALTFIAWFAMEGTAYFMENSLRTKNKTMDIIWNLIMIVGVLTIIVGGIMHLLNIAYATTTLTGGLTIVTSYILKDIFSPTKNHVDDANNEDIYF